MAKYEFEWADIEVLDLQLLLDQLLEANLPSSRASFLRKLADQISKQKPVPLPTGYGAVIVSKEHGMLIRVRKDNDRLTEWTQPHGEVFSSAEVGTVTEVLSEGLVQE